MLNYTSLLDIFNIKHDSILIQFYFLSNTG